MITMLQNRRTKRFVANWTVDFEPCYTDSKNRAHDFCGGGHELAYARLMFNYPDLVAVRSLTHPHYRKTVSGVTVQPMEGDDPEQTFYVLLDSPLPRRVRVDVRVSKRPV